MPTVLHLIFCRRTAILTARDGFAQVRVTVPVLTDCATSKWISKWIGHWAQTENHWANIPTSYAILDQIFVPFLQKNAAANGLSADYPAILIVDCWYGWKDQDKNKNSSTFVIMYANVTRG